MANILLLPPRTPRDLLTPNRAYYLSAVGWPNTSPQIKSVFGNVQLGFVVHV